MPRYAAIDIGTNSVKITVAEVRDGRIEEVLAERSQITRLGRGVDSTGRLADDAAQATLAAISQFTDEARALGVAALRACGTSALRDAENGKEFRRRAAEIIGSEIEVISGDREAGLTFLGALSSPVLRIGMDEPVLAFDVGGGSTELIVGSRRGIVRSQSIDLGAVRLTERLIKSDPPAVSELDEAQTSAASALDVFQVSDVSAVIGIGGTATTTCAMLEPGSEAIEGGEVMVEQIDILIRRLAAMPLVERRAVPGLNPARADVIVAGMIVIRAVLERFGKDRYQVSKRGVRYGLLLEMAATHPA